uniref:Uncharacterized protein n=1 Tax=Macrostomum lignano TaxID=282301 RepID=A0A1I8FWM1_9PLAT
MTFCQNMTRGFDPDTSMRKNKLLSM